MNFLKPAKTLPLLNDKKVAIKYPHWRLRMFLVAYIGYFTYYFGRSSFDVSKQYITTLSPDELGLIGAGLGIAYGVSKFLMGNIADRSNAKVFLALGLLISGLLNLIIPSVLSLGVLLMFVIMFVNGWAQGMGWPACARIMTHWFCAHERGTKMGIWNTAHNVGAGFLAIAVVPIGLYLFNNDWHGLFYVAGILCISVAVLILIFGADTPQSVGLPAIEVYKGYVNQSSYEEKEFTAKEIFFKYVLNNKWVWLIAIANAFVYCARYGLLSWSTYYLVQVKHMSATTGLLGFAMFELPAIPGTIVIGWITDRFFNSRRAPVSVICMILFIAVLFVYWYSDTAWILLLSLSAMGVLIYGPVALIGILALDLVPKKAGGTAAGFTGLFGYFLGTVGAQAVIGIIATYLGWNAVFIFLISSCILATILLSICWNLSSDNKH
ncbi:OPA family glycerol-3-phosphate transporter-like MFS transporter [Allofrancisella inopinata]|uniref:MFS transporter n=1 Tax=Allofrancisella inopinata TaxID=1085647 RepID=A0AAE7CS27_9GAMM|nr:MFS transporter [Allofrancisella inopinata]QIV96318.1 MFS transporter [Allofrancisella inopinata]TDT74596.1 OPA family glycerol-3-phosphate transporter-like MFS transporter [Allofrancisella inopinata]